MLLETVLALSGGGNVLATCATFPCPSVFSHFVHIWFLLSVSKASLLASSVRQTYACTKNKMRAFGNKSRMVIIVNYSKA